MCQYQLSAWRYDLDLDLGHGHDLGHDRDHVRGMPAVKHAFHPLEVEDVGGADASVYWEAEP